MHCAGGAAAASLVRGVLQAEACLLRQDDLHAIWPLLQQASNDLDSAAGTHDDSWQQAKAMLDEMQDALLTN